MLYEVITLVNSFGMIVAEDLKIRNMVRNPYLSKSISDAGWGRFLNKLAYKAEEAGCRITSYNVCYTKLLRPFP